MRTSVRFILVLRSTFELTQEPMRFVFARQTDSLELMFMFVDQWLNVIKSLNQKCSSYKAIESLQKIWTKVLIWISLMISF